MKIPLCTPPEAKRFTAYLHSRYGIPYDAMKDWSWARHKESVWVLSRDAREWVPSKANVFALGLQAFVDATTFEPTSNFITLLGPHIRTNLVPLDDRQVDAFFGHKNIPLEHVKRERILSPGWVGVAYHGKIVGSAEVKGNHLIPNLPGQSHAEENE